MQVASETSTSSIWNRLTIIRDRFYSGCLLADNYDHVDDKILSFLSLIYVGTFTSSTIVIFSKLLSKLT